MMQIPTKLLSKQQTKLPTRANTFDAGADLYALEDVRLFEFEPTFVHTGVSVAIPEGYVGLIFARSSNAMKGIHLANSVGVIDSGYRGELMLPLVYHPPVLDDLAECYDIREGDRVAQLVILPCALTEFIAVDTLPPSLDDRDTGGFGSTGD